MTVSGTGFNDSNMKCKSLGGNLASIHSVEENNFLAQRKLNFEKHEMKMHNL